MFFVVLFLFACVWIYVVTLVLYIAFFAFFGLRKNLPLSHGGMASH